jgi:hypothetical protein
MEVAVTLIALATFVCSFALGRDRRERARVVVLAIAVSGIAGGVVVFGGLMPVPPTPGPGPVQVLRDGYVSSDRCRACHPSQYESWHQSFHRTMTQPGTLDTIAAPLTGEPIEMWGQRYRFFERDGQPWVELPDPSSTSSRQDRNASLVASGPRIERPLALVTGSHHYQVYWASRSDDSRDLIAVPLVWRIAEQRFIPRSAAFLTPPEMSNRELPWRLVCLKCHVTGGRPGVDRDTDYVELGIACEACHGPAQEHIEHHQDPIRRYRAHFRHADGQRDPTIVDPAKLEGSRGSEICAQCHSLLIVPDADGFIANGTPFRPGDAIAEHFPELRGESESEAERASSFWSDGEIRLTGREWVAMTQSACHVRGELSCMDCHSMHEGSREDQLIAPAHDTDASCLECHAHGDYELEAHTHHQAGSSGSACTNCHMPLTNYGLLGAVRTHRITSPVARTTLATGRPNACNLCHLDQTLAWTADKLSAWYGHEGVTVSGSRADVADSVYAILSGDAGQRALAAYAMGWAPAQQASGTSWMPPFLVLGLNDPYDAVRQIAERSLRTLPGYDDFAYDALGVPNERIADVENLIPEWFERHRSEIAAMPTTVPLDPTFGFDRELLQTLLMQRDQRPIVLTE